MVCEPLISQKNNCTKVYCSHMKGIFMNLLNLLIYLGSKRISGAFKSLCGSKHFTACLGRREKLAKIHIFPGQMRSCTGLWLVFPPTGSYKDSQRPQILLLCYCWRFMGFWQNAIVSILSKTVQEATDGKWCQI